MLQSIKENSLRLVALSCACLRFLSVLFLLFFFSQQAYADEVDSWLDKMTHAIHQQNYQGTLIIRQDNKLQAIKVKQGITENGSWQTLDSLTGEVQTIVRKNGRVSSIFPAKKLVTITAESRDKSPLHPALPQDYLQLKKFYALKLGAQDRVANKPAQIVKMIPFDQYRYGYVFWLDQQTGFLLKCDLINEKGRVLEQQMYSNIELLKNAPESYIDEKQFADFEKIYLSEKNNVSASNWQAKNIPLGFVLTRSVKTQQSYHMVYSDGMASVSVFIEPDKKLKQPVIGQSSMGLVNVYSAYVNDNYITAIGEVPASTVQMIAQSMQFIK